MKLLSRGRGQLLIYFLVIATFIAIIWGTVLKFNMQEYNRQLRMRYIVELKAECDYNMSQCRIAMADAEAEGGRADEKLVIKTKALRNFIKVLFKQFNFSTGAWDKWFEFQKRLEAFDLLKGGLSDVEIYAGDCGDVYRIYFDFKLFLVKAQGNNYNFNPVK